MIFKQHIPLIALVGRPNVGKSTIFNRLVGRRTALVHNQPGVTRDRIVGRVRLEEGLLRVVDTGGLEPDVHTPMLSAIKVQTQLAIDEADYIFMVVDAHAGLTADDKIIADMLRRSGKPVMVLANKIDTFGSLEEAAEFYALGFATVLPISAEHGRGMQDLGDYILQHVGVADPQMFADLNQQEVLVTEPEEGVKSQIEWQGGPIRIAVVGRPNAGKSSLINAIIGSERHVASDMPGTTRDAVDSDIIIDGQQYTFVDTAGIRRKRSIDNMVERFSVSFALDSIDRADMALLMLDGTVAPTEQDTRIASMIDEKGKGLVIGVNKWDMVTNPEWRTRYMLALEKTLGFVGYAPVITMSAKTGYHIPKLLKTILTAQQERHRRIGTGELNRFFGEVVNSHPPPIQGSMRPRLYFVSQPLVKPPTFVFTCNKSCDLPRSYVRYLQNSLRERYGFIGTPLWLKFRAHQKGKSIHTDSPA